MRGFPFVTAAVFVQYLLWVAVRTRDVLGKLFGPGSDPRLTLLVLGWGVALSVLAATFSLGLVALVTPRRREGSGRGRMGAALVLASLMIGGLMMALAQG